MYKQFTKCTEWCYTSISTWFIYIHFLCNGTIKPSSHISGKLPILNSLSNRQDRQSINIPCLQPYMNISFNIRSGQDDLPVLNCLQTFNTSSYGILTFNSLNILCSSPCKYLPLDNTISSSGWKKTDSGSFMISNIPQKCYFLIYHIYFVV